MNKNQFKKKNFVCPFFLVVQLGGREREIQLFLAPAAPAWDSSSPINVIIYILCLRFFVLSLYFYIKIRIYRLKNTTTKKNEKPNTNYRHLLASRGSCREQGGGGSSGTVETSNGFNGGKADIMLYDKIRVLL